jgi:GT2 family glycosyltransferase
MTPAVAPEVSVVVVNYNGGGWVLRCASAVLESTASVELIIFDNASIDGSVGALNKLASADSRVRVIVSKTNLGFAAGCNRGLAAANPESEFVLFLNPDCVIGNGTIARMGEAMRQHPEAGLAGCLIRNPDGSEQRGSRRRMPTPMSALARVLKFARWFPGRQSGFDLNTTPAPVAPVEVEAISGAFMFARKRVLPEVGSLDEGYFLHCEDLDWCMRFNNAGWKILFVPDVAVTHAQGSSSKTTPVRVELYKHQGMLRFYRKFYRQRYGLPLYLLVVAAVWLRFAAKAAWLGLSPGEKN